jgi:hypothetical protein
MYGSDGPSGVDPPLLVRPAPGVGDLPLGQWVEITGHVDDAAAAECTRRWTVEPGNGPLVQTPAEQVMTCREQFVITAVRATAAP